MEKLLTLLIVHTDTEILLGMKKRGFGQGKWNGFGGKVMEGESIEEAAIREAQEEAAITPLEPEPVGDLRFYFTDGSIHHVHIFSANTYEGIPVETEEMKPQWFSLTDIPYDSMWEDDMYWLPLLLEGRSFTGSFTFDAENKLTEYTLNDDDHVRTTLKPNSI